jgi:GGDEF domain-containing protein
LNIHNFQQEVAREFARAQRGGASGVLVYIDLNELSSQLRERLAARSVAQIAKQMVALINANLQPLDLVGRDHHGRFVLLLPEVDAAAAQGRLADLARRIAARTFTAGTEHLHLTPTIGFSTFDDARSAAQLHTQALIALGVAATHLDLQPTRYHPAQDADHSGL